MKAKDVIKVYLERNSLIEDITEGLLTLQTASGVDFAEGIWQQPEVGQFRLVTRNPNIDPNDNPELRYNSKIIVTKTSQYFGESTIFTGYVTDISVEYRLNENPIITINGTDIVGLLNRYIITQDMIDQMIADQYLDANGRGNCFSVIEWLGGGFDTNFPYTFGVATKYGVGSALGINPVISFDSEAIPQIGESVWEFTSKLITSDLSFAYITPDSTIFISPHFKYDPGYYDLQSFYSDKTDDEILNEESMYFLSSDPDYVFDTGQTTYNGYGYKSIFLTDGFDRTVNQIKLSNKTYAIVGGEVVESTEEFEPFIDNQSALQWGPAEISLETMYPSMNQAKAEQIANDIFELSATPQIEIASISIDGLVVEKSDFDPGVVFDGQVIYEQFTCGDQIKIYHQVNQNTTINKLYSVVGVQNEINESDWRVTLILRKSELQEYLDNAPEMATINLTPTSGDTNTSFTGTVTNYTAGQFKTIEWELNGDFYVRNPNPPSLYWNYPTGSYPEFYGLTQTWNYDDDGPLGPFGPNGYGTSPSWQVAVWVENDAGWKKMSRYPDPIEVNNGVLTAEFTYIQNSFGGITVYDASVNAEEWLWDFGDGTTSTLQNPPTKYYTATGTYDITLQTSDGIQTVTSAPQTITMTNELVPVKFVKFDITGTRTRANSSSPWNKNIVRFFKIWTNWFGSNGPLYAYANKGTITNVSNQVISDGYQSTRYMQNIGSSAWSYQGLKVNPLVTNNGNTEEYDATFIVNVSVRQTNNGLSEETVLADTQFYWGDPPEGHPSPDLFNQRFKFSESTIFPVPLVGGSAPNTDGWTTNTIYEPIPVSVSGDGINWVFVGNWRIFRTTYPPSGTYVGWNLTDKVPFPPRFPA